VLLDPGRKVNGMFVVEGIPKSFVYDREGKLVGAVDRYAYPEAVSGNAGESWVGLATMAAGRPSRCLRRDKMKRESQE